MDTWRALNPDWEFLLWGNEDFAEQDWFNRGHMDAMHGVVLTGVADMMRWEILHAKGGEVVDADSILVEYAEPAASSEAELLTP